MTSQEPANEAEEIVATPATPGATALPTSDDGTEADAGREADGDDAAGRT